MIRRLLLALALTSATACTPLSARGLVQLDLVDRDTGQTLPEYAGRGQRWVAGTPGHRYSVRMTNNSDERVLVVLSVDGVNAVTGETAAASQNGYVLDPWQSADIAGWRKSLDDIAQFVFTDLPDSYAARTGRPDNVGVVGIAVFREHPRQVAYPMPAPPLADAQRAMGKAAAPSAAREAAAGAMADAESMPQRQRLGTGHGAREWSPVGQTTFERASSRPSQVSQLRYDDADALVAMGILPRYPWRYADRDVPRAFPNGFVADPPNW